MKAREFANTKLVVFDIDDTLVNTDTRVNVVRDGEVVKQLNSHDFTHYRLQPGEEFDFGRFRDAREFYTNARPIAPMIDRLRRDIATGNKVIMLTARADFNDRDVFLDTFRKYGIDMDRVHVYRAGNLQTRAATEEKKKIILQHLLDKQHYDKVIMYDDSVPNLNAFLTLSSDFPWSRFYAWHVDPNGRATEYHRSGLREDSDTENLPSVARAQQAIPQILARAQRDYDAWDEEDRDTYAGGGICHIIADSVCDVLSDAGIECTSVSCSHEQHVYVAARFAEGIYTIDIPYHVYEQGGGFSWKKLPDVRFEPRDVVFYRVSGDPADWRDYLDEGLRDIVNYIRNIGSEQDAPIVMMTNPQNTGARTASGQRMRIEDFPLKTVAVSELRPWEPMIKMQDLPSRRTVASLIKTLRQGGRIPPLLVTPVRGGYRIIDGHHRYAALQRAGVEHTPVRVVDPRLIRYSDEVREALKITLERYGHLAVKEQANPKGEIKLGPQLFVSRQTTTEDIKPRGVAWTSTAQKTPQGFTSDWVEWCKDNMAQWVTDTGILYDVAPGARILLVRTDRDVIQVARRYGLEIKNSFDLFEKMDWDVLRQDYDAVHHIPQGRDPFMSAWDVESTAWFDRKFLTNPRRVTVDTGKTHDIEETGKPGVAESLDQPYRIKWERSPFGDLDAIATLEDGSNLLIMFNNEVYQWRVEFYRGDRQDITGEGDAQRIFATVLKAIREFIRRKKPPSIVFGSVKEIDPRGSRTRLYDRMVQRYANDLGYTLHRQQDSAHTVYRLDRQQDVAEGLVNETQTVTRIDSKPITDFASELRAYKHTDDWSQSGIDTGDNSYWRKNNLQVKTTKGLFAGDPKRTALYATGNAHETRYVEFTRNGKSYVYFAAEDVPRFKNRKTYLSVFDAKNFRKLPTGEYFSENPGAPIKQIEITDPFAYIQKQGWNVRITRDLDKVFQQVKDMHQRGKIPYYGGEGMSESQQGVAEGQLDEIYKMPPTKNSSQGMTVWAYNDAIEKKSPVVYRGNDVIIFAANENLLRYIRLQDGKPVLYIGFTRFLDGYKSGTVATEMSGRGKGLAKQAYLDASDILKAPIYSDSTQTDASRLGIWDKLIQQYPDRVVGFDQKNNQNLSLSMTDRGPVVNQNQPIYVDRNKKDSAKPVAPNQKYRTRILKLLPVRQGVQEGRISDLDIDLQDQQWEAVVGRVEHGVRRGEDPDHMSLALYQWATGEMFDMDEELERRGFGSVADLADHIRDHGGRYVPPEFDLGAAGSLKDIERRPRQRPDDVSEATSEPDFMRGHCHVMALALLTLHPDWQLRAHIGWDEDAESDRDYRVDHVYVMAPDGTVYDCRGRFASEQELVGPDETGGAETQFIDYDISRVRADVARGELRPFSRRDLEKARAFARRLTENFTDGRKPGRKGLSKRVGIPRKATLGQLEKIARSSTGERRRMAQWQLNMRRGQKKNK